MKGHGAMQLRSRRSPEENDVQGGRDIAVVRERISSIVRDRLGGVEEELVGAGLLDSLKAISLALTLEKEFGVSFEEMSVDDMVTLTSLTQKVHSILMRPHRGG